MPVGCVQPPIGYNFLLSIAYISPLGPRAEGRAVLLAPRKSGQGHPIPEVSMHMQFNGRMHLRGEKEAISFISMYLDIS